MWSQGRQVRSGFILSPLPSLSSTNLCVFESFPWCLPPSCLKASSQLSATDVSARTTMKGAAKCDKHCDLQNSVNQQGFERILRFRDTPESMPASESILVSCCRRVPQPRAVGRQESVGRVCAPRSSAPLMQGGHTCPPQRRATIGTRNLAACYRCKSSVGLSIVKCYLARAPAPWPLP